jgi:hypothetical protein
MHANNSVVFGVVECSTSFTVRMQPTDLVQK